MLANSAYDYHSIYLSLLKVITSTLFFNSELENEEYICFTFQNIGQVFEYSVLFFNIAI